MPERECHCLICEGDGTRQRWWRSAERSWHPRERRNARLVREYGWGVTGVVGTTMPDWAYTIGLWHSFGSVEVCLLGLPQQQAMSVVNAVGDRVRDGLVLTPDLVLTDVAVSDGALPDGAVGAEVTFAPVHDSWYERFFGAAIDYYRRPPLPIVQLRWPGVEQPSLWLPLDEHPPGVWTAGP